MSKLTRRSLFPVAGIGVLAVASQGDAADVGMHLGEGLNVKLRFFAGQRYVPVVAWEAMPNWIPGQALMYRDVLLEEFLAQVEEALDVRRKSS